MSITGQCGHRGGDRGAILIHAALGLLAIMAMSAFAIDHGLFMVSRRQAQNAADAAALAGAGAIAFDKASQSNARSVAIEVAMMNAVWGAEPSITAADVTFPACPPNAPAGGTCIRVEVFRTVSRGNALPSIFGVLVGVDSQDIQATATACATAGSPPLALDEDAIDNGSPPNNFSASDVNDDISALGQRMELRYWTNHPGAVINLGSGQPGDEGWFAIDQIQQTWIDAGPTNDGAMNYWLAGPGLGTGPNPEEWLDKVPDINPLDGYELTSLIGQFVCAVVPDGDISMNYSPTTGSLKGNTIGVVGMTVLDVVARGGGFHPWVTVQIGSSGSCASGLGTGAVRLVR